MRLKIFTSSVQNKFAKCVSCGSDTYRRIRHIDGCSVPLCSGRMLLRQIVELMRCALMSCADATSTSV